MKRLINLLLKLRTLVAKIRVFLLVNNYFKINGSFSNSYIVVSFYNKKINKDFPIFQKMVFDKFNLKLIQINFFKVYSFF